MPQISSLESSGAVFEVTALGVGHGDAILLTWSCEGDCWTCLIDGGESPRELRSALSRQGVKHLDLLFLSHFDNDHLGGLLGIAAHVSIGEYWGPATPAYSRHLWIFGDRCRNAIDRAVELEDELRKSSIPI